MVHDMAEQMLSEMRLIELLTHQRSLYRKLKVLAERQQALVSHDDTEALLKLLAERQKLVDGLVKLNEQIAPYRQQWSTFFGSLSTERRDEISDLLEEVNTSLGSILKNDARDTAVMNVRRERVSSDIGHVDGGRRATAAYGGQRSVNSLTDAKA